MRVLSPARSLAVCLAVAALAPPACAFATKPHPDLARLETRYARLLARYRPDLADDWDVRTPINEPFVGLDEPGIEVHLRELRELHSQAQALSPSARADSLRARLEREIAQSEPGGPLHRDPLLWLDIVSAAARSPLRAGPMSGCSRIWRVTGQLRAVPDALRGAAVLLRAAPAPESKAFEARVSRVEWLFRQDLPSRTEVCREARRTVEFMQADTLAARALAVFRSRVTTPP